MRPGPKARAEVQRKGVKRMAKRIILVDLSGHADPTVKVTTDGESVEVAELIQPKFAGMFLDFSELEEQVEEFSEKVEETLKEAFERALEEDCDAVVLVPHGMSSLMTVIQLSGFPVRGVDLLVAFWNAEDEVYVLVEPRRVRVMPR